MFHLPNDEVVILYRDYGSNFEYDNFLLLFNKNLELVDEIVFWGKIINIKENTIFAQVYKYNSKNENPLYHRKNSLVNYTINYEESTHRYWGGSRTQNKALDSITFNLEKSLVTLYYRIKPDLVEKESRQLAINELLWNPDPASISDNGQLFYQFHSVNNDNISYYEYFVPNDSTVRNDYFIKLLTELKKKRSGI